MAAGQGNTDQIMRQGNLIYIKASDGHFYPVVGDTSGYITPGHNITGIGHGVKTCGTAGNHEAIAASTAAKKVIIQSQTDNTSVIAVGATGVDATIATGTGLVLYPGDWTPPLEIDNLADVFIDSLVNGEGVRFVYFT